jgi:predicted ester cyclase
MLDNSALVHRLHEIWNTGNLGLIDSVYAEDFVAHWPASSEIPERRGIAGVRFGVERIRRAFPDWHENVLDVFGSGDRVASRYLSTGTHCDTYWDIEATGRHIEIQEISLFRIREDRIVEQWCMFDELARLQQLNVGTDRLRRALRLSRGAA